MFLGPKACQHLVRGLNRVENSKTIQGNCQFFSLPPPDLHLFPPNNSISPPVDFQLEERAPGWPFLKKKTLELPVFHGLRLLAGVWRVGQSWGGEGCAAVARNQHNWGQGLSLPSHAPPSALLPGGPPFPPPTPCADPHTG